MASPADFLDRIVTQKRDQIHLLYQEKGISFYQDQLTQPVAEPQFRTAISQPGLSLIAEIKKASPSKGVIRKDFHPVQLAKEFEQTGAAALSVLTETHYFQGSPKYIPMIKAVCTLPILRKDFIIDPIQVYETKSLGADAILLIKALLSDDKCQSLLELANDLKLDALVEVHTKEELEKVLRLSGQKMIGINNRDLKTFEVDIETASRLKEMIRGEEIVVAESGYRSQDQLRKLEGEGFSAVLIGEGLVENLGLWDGGGKRNGGLW